MDKYEACSNVSLITAVKTVNFHIVGLEWKWSPSLYRMQFWEKSKASLVRKLPLL